MGSLPVLATFPSGDAPKLRAETFNPGFPKITILHSAITFLELN